jgi:hypothetical protein
MPIHDWSRIDVNLFHHFHQAWTITICNTLNAGLLPKHYSALVEQNTSGVEPDVIALQRRPRTGRATAPTGGAVVTGTPPKTRYVFRAHQELFANRRNWITIRDSLDTVVCVIEIVSRATRAVARPCGRSSRRPSIS